MTVPTNDPAGSGWNYEGQFGDFLGTPIAPHFFLTAKHIGHAGSVFTFGATNYNLVTHFNDPFSDFTIWQVVQTFPTFAPLYTGNDEIALRLVVVGRGTQRGGKIRDTASILRGWSWGSGDGVQRWGENLVADIINFSSGPDDAIYATFDQNGLPEESHLSSGDSGGAVFIQDADIWKLAGINYAVDGNFTPMGPAAANSLVRYLMRVAITTPTAAIRRITLRLSARTRCPPAFTPPGFHRSSPGSIASSIPPAMPMAMDFPICSITH